MRCRGDRCRGGTFGMRCRLTAVITGPWVVWVWIVLVDFCIGRRFLAYFGAVHSCLVMSQWLLAMRCCSSQNLHTYCQARHSTHILPHHNCCLIHTTGGGRLSRWPGASGRPRRGGGQKLPGARVHRQRVLHHLHDAGLLWRLQQVGAPPYPWQHLVFAVQQQVIDQHELLLAPDKQPILLFPPAQLRLPAYATLLTQVQPLSPDLLVPLCLFPIVPTHQAAAAGGRGPEGVPVWPQRGQPAGRHEGRRQRRGAGPGHQRSSGQEEGGACRHV